jgi:predicted O-methyltransferase YrrM
MMKRILLRPLGAMWLRLVSAKKLRKRGAELGLFVADARRGYVYVPRARVADREPAPPPILNRELDAFYVTADKVISDGVTMMRYERLFTIWQALANTKHIADGSMAEIGVWRGGTSYLMARGRRQFVGSDVPLISIDTFEGHPGETICTERDPLQRAGKFASTSREQVENLLSEFPMCEIIQGEVTKVLPTLPERRYLLVHIDTDIYASTVACLRYFHPRLVPGGIIVLDDFGAKTCPGVAKAFDEWFPGIKDCQFWQMRTEQCLITKFAAFDLLRRQSQLGSSVNWHARDPVENKGGSL